MRCQTPHVWSQVLLVYIQNIICTGWTVLANNDVPFMGVRGGLMLIGVLLWTSLT